MIRRPILVVLLLSLVSCADEDPPVPEAPRPHLLILVLDTTRADRCSLNGYRRSTTPRLEDLARDSVVFRQAWAPCSWTGPSHATLFTGLLPTGHGYLLGNRHYLDEGAVTIAEILRDAGYRTACFSSNAMVSPDFGLIQGFDLFMPFFGRRPIHASRAVEMHDAAAAWAERIHGSGERFFLFINDIEPHLPYRPPADVESRFVAAGSDRSTIAELREFQHPLQVGYSLGQVELPPEKLAMLGDLYDAEIAGLDAAVGRLVDRLRASGILDETLVIVVGDHGESLGEHNLIGHQIGLFRNLLHVPLLIRLPGRFDGGCTVRDLVRLEDILPTCLEIGGRPVPDGLDGRSLTRDLAGRVAFAAHGPDLGIAELEKKWPEADTSGAVSSLRSVFDGRYHLIYGEESGPQLFDLEEDPQETRNLATDLPGVVARLRALAAFEPCR